MKDAPESMGPIQMLSIAFDGNHFKGEILPELERLKREGLVRIVDMLLVRKGPLEDVMVSTASDLDWEEAVAFGSYVGAFAGFTTDGVAGMERGALDEQAVCDFIEIPPVREMTSGRKQPSTHS